MDASGDARGDLVVLSAGGERGNIDRRQLIRDVPVAEGALDRELAGPPHGPVDGLAEFPHRPGKLARPRREAADVAAVERHRGWAVRGIVEGRETHVRAA